MSQWLHLYSGKMNKVVNEIEKSKMMGENFGDLDLDEVISIIKGSKQELIRMENERNQLLSDNRDLRNKISEMQKDIDSMMGGETE